MEPMRPEGSSFPYWEDILCEGGLNIDTDLDKGGPRSDSASSFVGSPVPTIIIKHVSDPVVSDFQRRQLTQGVSQGSLSPNPKRNYKAPLERRHTDPGFKKNDEKAAHCFQQKEQGIVPGHDRESKIPKMHKLKPAIGRSSTPGSQEEESFISLDPLAAIQEAKPLAPILRPIPRHIFVQEDVPQIKTILRKGQVHYLKPKIIHHLVEVYKITPFEASCFNETDCKRFSFIHALTVDPDGRPCNNIRSVISSDIEKKTLLPKQVKAILIRHADSLFFLNPEEKHMVAECIKMPCDESLLVYLFESLTLWARKNRLTQALALTSFLSFYHSDSDVLKLQRCELLMWKGFYEKALKVAGEVLKKLPNQKYALVLKACCLFLRNAVDDAAEVMIAYSKFHEQCLYTRTLLGIIHSHMGKTQRFCESLDVLISSNPQYPFAIMLRAEFQYSRQHWFEASKDYAQILTLYPDYVYVRTRLDFIKQNYGKSFHKR